MYEMGVIWENKTVEDDFMFIISFVFHCFLSATISSDRRGTPPHYAQVEQTGDERQSIGPQR